MVFLRCKDKIYIAIKWLPPILEQILAQSVCTLFQMWASICYTLQLIAYLVVLAYLVIAVLRASVVVVAKIPNIGLGIGLGEEEPVLVDFQILDGRKILFRPFKFYLLKKIMKKE